MSDQKILYDIRRRIDCKRQPRHSEALEDLNDLLGTLELSHPYELEIEHIKEFMKKDAYANGCRGLRATIPKINYLYRIAGVKSVTDNVSELVWDGLTPDSNDIEIWNAINGDPEFEETDEPAVGRWRSLARYAQGRLTGYRGYTWWTSRRLSPENVVCWAHALGRYNDNVAVYALLLRCPVSSLLPGDFVFVPTMLDAFDQEIFHSTVDKESPGSGITINLEDSANLDRGDPEYTLGPIAVESVEIMPKFVGRPQRKHKVEPGVETWKLLEDYYNKLDRGQISVSQS